MKAFTLLLLLIIAGCSQLNITDIKPDQKCRIDMHKYDCYGTLTITTTYSTCEECAKWYGAVNPVIFDWIDSTDTRNNAKYMLYWNCE
jgi:hypothetical protein